MKLGGHMKLLVTNDDGIFAEGVYTLLETLKAYGDLTVVCPNQQKSGFGHSITVSRPMHLEEVDLMEGVQAYQLDGSPVDCVKVALDHILESKPDLIISGINAGANVGQDIYYSGTIGASREAVLYGLPAIAISLARDQEGQTNFKQAKDLLASLIDKLLAYKIPNHYLLNVNLPALSLEEYKGVQVLNPEVTQKKFDVLEEVQEGERVFRLSNNYQEMSDYQGQADYYQVKAGYVTISPVPVRVVEDQLCQEIQKIFK